MDKDGKPIVVKSLDRTLKGLKQNINPTIPRNTVHGLDRTLKGLKQYITTLNGCQAVNRLDRTLKGLKLFLHVFSSFSAAIRLDRTLKGLKHCSKSFRRRKKNMQFGSYLEGIETPSTVTATILIRPVWIVP